MTKLLRQWQSGDEEAMEALMPVVYEELRTLAGRHLRRERSDHTLSATALVHEAYVNLMDQTPNTLNDRVHFFAIASRVMRRVLVWHARKRNAAKRGGGLHHVPLDEAVAHAKTDFDRIMALDEALSRLERMDARLCRVVECRHFGGLSVPETGEALGISPATVKRDWRTARAWLKTQLDDSEPGPS